MSETKNPYPTGNPKDLVAGGKIDITLVPFSAIVGMATAFLEGALKYGRFNWRIKGVRASVYVSALLRHIFKWYNGQDQDRDTQVHHIDNAMACLAIIRDAIVYGKLIDDRAPAEDPDAMAKFIDSQANVIKHLQSLFKDHTPHQYTIGDTRDERREAPRQG